MKIDFTRAITDFVGQPVADEDGKPLTLNAISLNTLLATLLGPDGRPETLDGQTKVRHATLAQSIHAAPEGVDLKAEDVALIKDRIGKAYGPLVVMRAWDMLDPPAASA